MKVERVLSLSHDTGVVLKWTPTARTVTDIDVPEFLSLAMMVTPCPFEVSEEWWARQLTEQWKSLLDAPQFQEPLVTLLRRLSGGG